jgi:IMP dehydrogenase/GMP reductase
MAGGMFAGTDEAAGEVIERDGHKPTPNPNPNPLTLTSP